MNVQREVTHLLHEWVEGDAEAAQKLMPLVYEELRRLARAYLAQQRADHTLQPTALVHEAYLRLVDAPQSNWRDRAHFFRLAARAMRQILIDHARTHTAAKRGGMQRRLSIDEVTDAAALKADHLLALDSALETFAERHPREGEVVELKFFGGLNTEEISRLLDVSEKTVLRDWQFARLWLSRELSAGTKAA